ncbi:hypothetical protein R1sor_009592 [Riccia sorocarpa]|uniref:F-box domain-containing protein n=1 Tax=Riccia sorocarpa TaxID=122646 RepID=A0ABD3HZN4_9MARC
MEASEDLESTLWQQLPFELLENILTKLPVTNLMTDQGLICFKSHCLDTLFIYNPLTRQWKELKIPVEDDDPLPWQTKELGVFQDDHLLFSRTEDEHSSTWTSTSVYPDLPLDSPLEDELRPRWKPLWVPGASVRCGQNLYWLVEEADEPYGTLFRFIVRFDVKAGIWTVDEPDLPYQRLVVVPKDPAFAPSDFPYSYTLHEFERREPDRQLESKPPQWNFHLAPHDGVVYVMAFDSLIRREAFSGEFSSLMPEVKMVDADFVCKVRELADPPKRYLPTKLSSQGEVWYVVFEHGGVRWHERGTKPLLVFAYSPRRNI